MQRLILFLASCFLLIGCNSLKSIKTVFTATPPYEQYIEGLEKASLHQSAMAVAWRAAGKSVFKDSVEVNLPFSESGYFQASTPEARAYRFKVKDGQVLTVDGTLVAKENAKVFMDLFIWKNNTWSHVANADSTFKMSYEFNRDGDCLLRIQPELLINAYYWIGLSLTPVLLNPVSGASNKSIGSLYGAARDGGKRLHEGVDIFAPKGTPVIAPADGYISRVGNNNLGGKVVWMLDNKRGHAYYFAHLDSQTVKAGTRVKQGHILGTVGNTGNARATPPHLHFGIYQTKSKDPLYYIRTMETVVNTLPLDTSFRQQVFKVAAKKTNLRSGPHEKYKPLAPLVKNTYAKVIGQSQEWFRVMLPNQKQGFIAKKHLTPLEKGVTMTLSTPAMLLSETDTNAVPIKKLDGATPIAVLAVFGQYRYVQTPDGLTGWLPL